jgi:hypothetical protein
MWWLVYSLAFLEPVPVTQKISTETLLLSNLRVVAHNPTAMTGLALPTSNRTTAVGLVSVSVKRNSTDSAWQT